MPSVFLSRADTVVESVTSSSARLADSRSEDCFKAAANRTSELVSCACVPESDSRIVRAEGGGASRVVGFDHKVLAVVSDAGDPDGSRRERRVDVVRWWDTEDPLGRSSVSGSRVGEAGGFDSGGRAFSPRRSSSSVESGESVP